MVDYLSKQKNFDSSMSGMSELPPRGLTMEKSFWQNRWDTKQTGFHGSINPFLVKYIDQLNLSKDARIFIPLCGKTLDIGWLLSKGYRVVAIEFIDEVVQSLFAELNLTPEVQTHKDLKHYSANSIDVFSGDFFNLTKELLQSVDVVYDRAAIVALPKVLREKYSQHLTLITGKAPQLLVTYSYDQDQLDGPPFSVNENEVRSLYSFFYEVALLEKSYAGKFKNVTDADELVWHLK